MQGGQGNHIQKGTKATKRNRPPLHEVAPTLSSTCRVLSFFTSYHNYTFGVQQLVPSSDPSPVCRHLPAGKGCSVPAGAHCSYLAYSSAQSSTATLYLVAALAGSPCPSQQIAISTQLHKSTTDLHHQRKPLLFKTTT